MPILFLIFTNIAMHQPHILYYTWPHWNREVLSSIFTEGGLGVAFSTTGLLYTRKKS